MVPVAGGRCAVRLSPPERRPALAAAAPAARAPRAIRPLLAPRPEWMADAVPPDAWVPPLQAGPLRLVGVRCAPRQLVGRRMLWVESFWTADAPVTADLRIQFRAVPLRSTRMPAWGEGMDHEPCDWMWPTSRWEPGRIYRDRYGLRAPRAGLLESDVLQLELRVRGALAGLPPARRLSIWCGLRVPGAPVPLPARPAPVPAALHPGASPTPAPVWTAEQLQRITGGRWLVEPPPGWFVNSVVRGPRHLPLLPPPALFVAADYDTLAAHENYSKRLPGNPDRHADLPPLEKAGRRGGRACGGRTGSRLSAAAAGRSDPRNDRARRGGARAFQGLGGGGDRHGRQVVHHCHAARPAARSRARAHHRGQLQLARRRAGHAGQSRVRCGRVHSRNGAERPVDGPGADLADGAAARGHHHRGRAVADPPGLDPRTDGGLQVAHLPGAGAWRRRDRARPHSLPRAGGARRRTHGGRHLGGGARAGRQHPRARHAPRARRRLPRAHCDGGPQLRVPVSHRECRAGAQLGPGVCRAAGDGLRCGCRLRAHARGAASRVGDAGAHAAHPGRHRGHADRRQLERRGHVDAQRDGVRAHLPACGRCAGAAQDRRARAHREPRARFASPAPRPCRTAAGLRHRAPGDARRRDALAARGCTGRAARTALRRCRETRGLPRHLPARRRPGAAEGRPRRFRLRHHPQRLQQL